MNQAQAKKTASPSGAIDSTARKTNSGPVPAEDVGAESDLNSASGLIEAPLNPGGSKMKQHDFPDGGGSGGAEAFRRKPS